MLQFFVLMLTAFAAPAAGGDATSWQSQNNPIYVHVPEWQLGFLNWRPQSLRITPPRQVTSTAVTPLSIRNRENGSLVEVFLRQGAPEEVARDIAAEMCDREWQCKSFTQTVRSGGVRVWQLSAHYGQGRKERTVEVFVRRHDLKRATSVVIMGTCRPASGCIFANSWVSDTMIFGEVVPFGMNGLVALASDPDWDWLRNAAPSLRPLEDRIGVSYVDILSFANKKTKAQIRIRLIRGQDDLAKLYKMFGDLMTDAGRKSAGVTSIGEQIIFAHDGTEVYAVAFKKIGSTVIMGVGIWPEEAHQDSRKFFSDLVGRIGLPLMEQR